MLDVYRETVRPVVLTYVAQYLPGFKSGGPVRTIVNMVDALHDEFDFRIVAQDRDLGDAAPYPDLPTERWLSVGAAQVYYVPPARCTLRGLARIAAETPHDVLYLNSAFDPTLTIPMLLARRLRRIPRTPTIVAPRGEFGAGSFRIRRLKKRVYLAAANAVGLYSGVRWQASSPDEQEDIAHMMGMAGGIHVAPDMPTAFVRSHRAVSEDTAAEGAGHLRVLYLGRISREKNLDYSLRVLREVTVPVLFDVYGPEEDASYWRECQQLIAQLPGTVKVRYRGAVRPEQVPAVLAQYDLMLMPTTGENYGHAIIESLMAGTPVLISDRTPWRELARDGLGWDLSLDQPAEYARKLDELATVEPGERAARRAPIRENMTVRLNLAQVDAANRSLFRSCLQDGCT